MSSGKPRSGSLDSCRSLHSGKIGLVHDSAGLEYHPTVFLHSSFRTGSTWFWQKLRAVPTTVAYCEIFHEALEVLTVGQAREISYATWDSRHPVASPYFLEYLPLLKPEGGIDGFASSAADRLIPTNGPDCDLDVGDQIHVEKLISLGRASKRIPVLSCTRSLGRARALKHAFGGQAILLHRNLFHQWASYSSQLEAGNPYFMNTICRQMTGSRHDPFLRRVADWFDLAGSTPSEEVLFQVFILLQLYLLGIAFDAADLVVDLGEIAVDRTVRRGVESKISEMINHEVDLSDVRLSYEIPALFVSSQVAVRDTIEQFTKFIPAVSMSSSSNCFLERVKDAALLDWERFDLVNRRVRSISTARVQALAAESETLRAEKDRLTGELAASAQAIRQREDEANALREGLNTLRDGLAASETSRSNLASELAKLSAEAETVRVASLAPRGDAGVDRSPPLQPVPLARRVQRTWQRLMRSS